MEFRPQGMLHEEGGWGKEVEASEPEQKLRYTCVHDTSTMRLQNIKF